MKKIAFSVVAMGLLISFQPTQLKAESTVPKSSIVVSKSDDGIKKDDNTALILRLDEIKDMDHSQLKQKEKRALRKEVRSIENQLQNGGGAYISVGAAIIIILLIIILL